MTLVGVLDAGPVGMIINSSPRSVEATECKAWMESLVSQGVRLIIPEIIDYEVRRELIRAYLRRSIERLDQLVTQLEFQPLNTAIMHRAAERWAEARNMGRPTSDSLGLDCDMILVAHADSITAHGDDPLIATTNVRHLSQFTRAVRWRDIDLRTVTLGED